MDKDDQHNSYKLQLKAASKQYYIPGIFQIHNILSDMRKVGRNLTNPQWKWPTLISNHQNYRKLQATRSSSNHKNLATGHCNESDKLTFSKVPVIEIFAFHNTNITSGIT